MNISTLVRLAVPAPPEPKVDGTYQYGGQQKPIAQGVPASLPKARERPSLKALEARYPHVMEKIRAAWASPRQFDLLMRELLVPNRQDRQGFDPEAALELMRLREYYTLEVEGGERTAATSRPQRAVR